MVLIEAASSEALELIPPSLFTEYPDITSFFRSLNIAPYDPTPRVYAGVGSRDTPIYALAVMLYLSRHLSGSYIVRSGGAEGADMAFELASNNRCEIFLPWRGFRSSTRDFINISDKVQRVSELIIDGKFIKNIPPIHSTEVLRRSKNESNLKLHRRNCNQILGCGLNNPVSFMVCWTDDKAISASMTTKDTGGTATAIKLASHLSIEVFNLSRDQHLLRVMDMLRKHDPGVDDKIIKTIRHMKNNPSPWHERSTKRENISFDSEKIFNNKISSRSMSMEM